MNLIKQTALSLHLLTLMSSAFALDFNSLHLKVHPGIQLGGFTVSQGQQQHINISGLVGDEFTTTTTQTGNGLVGLNYFVEGRDFGIAHLSYGLNAFYLANTAVAGDVLQENFARNLAYSYEVQHFPVYAVAKSSVDLNHFNSSMVIDVGIGPNFMNTKGFTETPLNGYSVPDQSFSENTTTTFSVTAAIGLKSTHIFGQAPIECVYRFFYLGQGGFNKNNDQLLSTLNTGKAYANAVMCSVSL